MGRPKIDEEMRRVKVSVTLDPFTLGILERWIASRRLEGKSESLGTAIDAASDLLSAELAEKEEKRRYEGQW